MSATLDSSSNRRDQMSTAWPLLASSFTAIEQGAVIHREVIRAALEAESLRQLAVTLGDLLRRGVTFEDADGHLLAFWHTSEDVDPVCRATVEQGKAPSTVLAQVAELGCPSAIRSSAGPVRIPALPELGLSARVACPIWLKGQVVGMVWIVEGETQLTDPAVWAVEFAAQVAALHIANQRQLAAVEARLGATCLDALLDGRFEVTASDLERARLIGFDPESSHRVALFVIPESLPLSRDGLVRRDRLADKLGHRLSQLRATAVASCRLNHVICLLPGTAAPRELLDHVSHPGPPPAMVLGRAHVGAEGVLRSYREALAVVPCAMAGDIKRYEEILIPRVLEGNEEAKRDFLEQLLGPIRNARSSSVLIDSLLCYALHGFRRDRAAVTLHVHPNTLRYRLQRVSDLVGLDLDDPEVRFCVQLAAQLLYPGSKFRP